MPSSIFSGAGAFCCASMAGMRYVLALMALAVSVFCFIESLVDILIGYSAYKHGPIRGVPYQRDVVVTATLLTVSGLSYWAWIKILPKRVG